MPKPPNPKLTIHLDLLKPQSGREKTIIKLVRWLLSTGRYIFIFVEAIVLIAFAARFKLDGDLAANKEAIEQQIPYIESLKPFEILIRQTQFKLATINSFHKDYTDYGQLLKRVADQAPAGVKFTSLNLERETTQVTIKLNAQAQANNDLASFLAGLKQDALLTNITVSSLSFEKGILNFSLSAQAKLENPGGKGS